MRHEDDAGSARGYGADEIKNLRRLLHAKGGGRFVKADELHVLGKRSGYGDRLALAAGQRPHEDILIRKRDTESRQTSATLLGGFPVVTDMR